jgi:hypothetical protein
MTNFIRIIAFLLPILGPFLLIPVNSEIFTYINELKNIILILIFALAFNIGLKCLDKIITDNSNTSNKGTYLRIGAIALSSLLVVMSLYVLKEQTAPEVFWLLILYSFIAPAFLKALKKEMEIMSAFWALLSGMCLTIAVLVALGFWYLFPAIFLAIACNSAAYHLILICRLKNVQPNLSFKNRFITACSLLLFPACFAILSVSSFISFYYIFSLAVLPLIIRVISILKLSEYEVISIDNKKVFRLGSATIGLTILIILGATYLLYNQTTA